MATHQAPQASEKFGIPGVKTVLAVASGKGGVGKSTVSVNLALALKAKGKKVGLLDADVYGPSQHIMLGLKDRQPDLTADKKIIPIEKFGIKMVTFGFFINSEDPVVWRGPMIARVIQQFIRDVDWGELDVIVVDLPPGTGDVQLTLTQTLPITGAVIVSTPQDVALADAIKGVNMFKKVEVPVIGIIENMSFFECPKCAHQSHIFAHGGAQERADAMGVPFLGELPLEEATRAAGDAGTPIVVKDEKSNQSQRFLAIAELVAESLDEESQQTKPYFFADFNAQQTSGEPAGGPQAAKGFNV